MNATCDPVLDMRFSQEQLRIRYQNNPDLARVNSIFTANHTIKEGKVGFLVTENVPKPSKYRNVKVEHDGMKFDSKKELKCWQELKLREKAGEIWCLQRQPVFELKVNGKKIGKFTPDFVWYDVGGQIVADAKSPATRKETAYRLRKKLFEAIYAPLVIREL